MASESVAWSVGIVVGIIATVLVSIVTIVIYRKYFAKRDKAQQILAEKEEEEQNEQMQEEQMIPLLERIRQKHQTLHKDTLSSQEVEME